MKSLRTILFCSLFVFCLLISACSGTSQDAPSASPDASPSQAAAAQPASAEAGYYPVEVTDFLGHTSTIEGSDRIVSLTTSSTQILMALGAEDRIVGVDAYSEPFLPGTEVVGDYIGPDLEKITALEPDLVIAANSIQQDAIDQLRAVGIPVIAAEPTTWDEVSQGFEMIGRAVDSLSGAQVLSEQLETAVETAEKNAPDVPVSCYYVLSYGEAGNWTSGAGSFINAMMEYAGGEPVTKDVDSPWVEFPMEDLVQADPQCIILGSGAGSLEDFVQTAGYKDLSAVRSGHVYEIDSDLVTIPGPELTEGLQSISDIIGEAAEQEAAA